MYNKQSNLSLENITKQYEETWLQLKILKYPRIEALISLIHKFELMTKATLKFPLIYYVPKFVVGLRALNLLIPHILRHCPAQLISRNLLNRRGYKETGEQSDCDKAAMDALEFAKIYGFFQDFVKSNNVSIRAWNKYSVEILVENDFMFKEETKALLLWEEIDNTLLYALNISYPGNLLIYSKDILSHQINNFPLQDKWKIGKYTVNEWKLVLKNLIERAIIVKNQTPEMKLSAIGGEIKKLSHKISQEVKIKKKIVQDILYDLSYDIQDEKANFARTPFIIVDDFFVGSPSLLLIRRSDCQLLKQWAKRHPTMFNSELIANHLHEELAKEFRKKGCKAWGDVKYTSINDSKKRDIDVLVKDTEDNWLVIQVKAFLTPSPASESIRTRIEECQHGFDQITDARDTILKDQQRILSRYVKKSRCSYSVRSCNGILVTTHTYGVPYNAEFPSVEHVLLRNLIKKISPSVSIPKLLNAVKNVNVSLQSRPICWQVLWEKGFTLRFPCVEPFYVHPVITLLKRALSILIFHFIRIFFLIQRKIIK